MAVRFVTKDSVLIGLYRARRSQIAETLALHSDGTFVHGWVIDGHRSVNSGAWQGECTILLKGYEKPNGAIDTEFLFPGPRTYWIVGEPTLGGSEAVYVWSGRL